MILTFLREVVLFSLLLMLSGCYTYLPRADYQGPPKLPASLASYYSYEKKPFSFKVIPQERKIRYQTKRIELDTVAGPVVIDFYQRYDPTKELIFVLPIL